MAENNRETRVVAECELRAVGDGDKKPTRLEGYAALFNKPAEIWDGYYEQVAPGAFARTLREGADVRALFNHNPDMVLGRNTANTLTLRETRQGLKVNIWPPDTQLGRDMLVSVGRGDITQMSFAFRAVEEHEEDKGDRDRLRTLEDVDLFDVSVVTNPAYPDTSVVARSYEERTGQKPVVRAEAPPGYDPAYVYYEVLGDPKTASGPDPTTLRMTARTLELKAREQEREAS